MIGFGFLKLFSPAHGGAWEKKGGGGKKTERWTGTCIKRAQRGNQGYLYRNQGHLSDLVHPPGPGTLRRGSRERGQTRGGEGGRCTKSSKNVTIEEET